MGVTVTWAVPDREPLVAVIAALPAETPLTNPVDETVAMVLSDDENVTVLFGTTRPRSSSTCAVTWAVAPCWTRTCAGVTTTALGGRGFTVTDVVPVFPSTVAVMVALPGECAVTTPVDVTVATLGRFVDHITTRPVSGLPATSSGCACSCAVWPSISDCEVGVTRTDATGMADTVTDAWSVFPSEEAVMMAPPGASAVTVPFALTVATPSLLLLQVIGRPVRIPPDAALVSAVNWKLSSTNSDLLPGVTRTLATGIAVTVTCAMPLRPPVLAATWTVPIFRAVTRPPLDTVAIASSSDAQCTGRVNIAFPVSSSTCAARATCAPTATVERGGVTITLSTAPDSGPVESLLHVSEARRTKMSPHRERFIAFAAPENDNRSCDDRHRARARDRMRITGLAA